MYTIWTNTKHLQYKYTPKYEYINVYKYIGNCPHPATFLKGIYQGGPLY